MKPRIEYEPDRDAIVIEDPIQGRQYPIDVQEPVDIHPADTDQFQFPVETAVETSLSRLSFPSNVNAYVRTQDGTLIEDVDLMGVTDFDARPYSVEFTPPIKLYLQFDGGFSILSFGDQVMLDFDGVTNVAFGARSFHEQPAETITVPRDPSVAMEGLSILGSSLKTLSPERSFPTLRGYPPLVELGDTLAVPSSLDRPNSSLRIGCRPNWEHLLLLAPLAYYLGARFECHDEPAILGPGFVHELAPTSNLWEDTKRTLKQLFLLDCVVRTTGFYDVDLASREVVDERLTLEYRDLYESPIAERTQRYLDVPYETVEDILPTWRFTADVEPVPSSLEYLPHILNDMGLVRVNRDPETTTDSSTTSSSQPDGSAVDAFVRSLEPTARSTPTSCSDQSERTYVSLDDVDSIEHAWAGTGRPMNSDKLVLEGYEHQLERGSAGDIEISVVCNDEAMSAERSSPIYGGRDDLPFSISMSGPLTVDGLREKLQEDVDFFHYIGHVDEDGFRCEDGTLQLSEESFDVAPAAFFLNACQSYDQGIEMVRSGSIGGIVTLADVVNSSAVHMGQLVARLLNEGFSLRSALDLASDVRVIGNQYLVVGDGGTRIAQSVCGTPYLVEIESTDLDRFETTIHGYPSVDRGIGSIFRPVLDQATTYYLNAGEMDTFELSKDELSTFLSLQRAPLLVDGELRWSDEFSLF